MGMYERISFHRTCRGSGDGMQAKRTRRNTGSPSGDRCMDQLAARERKAGPTGMAEGLVVLRKPGNAGGGKGCVKKTCRALCCAKDEGGPFGAVL
jgi:hypothetical protein